EPNFQGGEPLADDRLSGGVLQRTQNVGRPGRPTSMNQHVLFILRLGLEILRTRRRLRPAWWIVRSRFDAGRKYWHHYSLTCGLRQIFGPARKASGSRPLTLKRGQIAGEFRVRVVWRQIEKELRCEEIYVRSTSRRLEILNPPWRSAGRCSRSAPLI